MSDKTSQENINEKVQDQINEINKNKKKDENIVLQLSTKAIVTLVTVILTMAGFWLIEGSEYITKSEAKAMINDRNSFIMQTIENKNEFILQRIEDRENNQLRLERVLERNTEAISGLKIEMATLNATLQKQTNDKDKNR